MASHWVVMLPPNDLCSNCGTEFPPNLSISRHKCPKCGKASTQAKVRAIVGVGVFCITYVVGVGAIIALIVWMVW